MAENQEQELEQEILQKKKLLWILEGYSFAITVYVMAYVAIVCLVGLLVFVWLSVLFWFASMQDGEMKFEFLKYGFWGSMWLGTIITIKLNWSEMVEKILTKE